MKLCNRSNAVVTPEFRLPLAVVAAFTLPGTVLLFGWVAHLQLPLGFLLATLILLGASISLSSTPIFAYIVDAFGVYSASAMSGIVVTRCLLASFLPVGVRPLIERFSYGWAFTILSVVGFCLAPIPIILMLYGSKWRQKSRYTKDPQASR